MAMTRRFLAVLLCAGIAVPAGAQGWRPMMTATPDTVPLGINYQGRLESIGFPHTGTVIMSFAVFTVPTGGFGIWFSPSMNVTVLGGIFGVTLDIPKETLMGSTQKYLEVTVDGQIITPRDPLRSVPYAKIAESVEGSIDISTGGLKFTTAGGDALVISTITCLGCVGVGAAAAAGNRLSVQPWASDDYALVVSSQNGTTLLGVDRAGVLSLSSPLGGAYGGTGANMSGVGVAGAIPYFTATGVLGGSSGAGASTQLLRSGAAGAPTWMSFGTAAAGNTIVSRSGAGAFNAGMITANLTGGVTGTATYATDLVGGLANQLPYQTGASATGFLGGAIGDVLILSGAVPAWGSPGGLPAASADDLTSGAAGEVIYQNGAADTRFLAAGAVGQVLRSGGAAAPGWVDQNTLGVGTATSLAADGSDCPAGSTLAGVDASGGGEGCFDATEPLELAAHDATATGTHGATAANTANAIAQRDASGNFSAGVVTAVSWAGTADTAAALAANGSNCGAGNPPLGVDTAGAAEGCFDAATQVEMDAHANSGGGSAVHGAASGNTVNRIVTRDASGNFSAGTVTAALNGNASSMSALQSNGSNCGLGLSPRGVDASGNAENCFDVATPTEITAHGNLNGLTGAHGADSGNTASAIVARDILGNFSAGTVSAALNGNAGTMTALAGDGTNCAAGLVPLGVSASGAAENCFDVTEQTELNTHAAWGGTGAHSAASANTANMIVTRDASGNFTATTITAALSGNANTATNLLANPTGCGAGLTPRGAAASGAAENCFDVLTQSELDLHNADPGHGATSAATAGAIAARDASGNFGAIGMTLSGFMQVPSKTKATLQGLTAGIGHVYYCSNCSNSVNLVIATGTLAGQFATFGDGSVAWQ